MNSWWQVVIRTGVRGLPCSVGIGVLACTGAAGTQARSSATPPAAPTQPSASSASGDAPKPPAPIPSPTAPGELLLWKDAAHQVIAHLRPGACDILADTEEFTVEVRSKEQTQDTFHFPVYGAPAACDSLGRGVEAGDYNFDGRGDLAVPVDRSGPYGAQTYAILLLQPATGRFQEAPALSKLTRENLGMFTVNPQRQLLLVSGKSGCCIHYQQDVSVHGNEPNVVGSEVESVVFEGDSCHVLTQRTGIRGEHTVQRACTKGELP